MRNKTRKVKKLPENPNIVYIMLDDWGYYELSCLGHPIIETPNIDCIVQEGMRFTQGLAGASVCAPTRCTLLTGQHTGHCSVRENDLHNAIRPDEVTLGNMLRDNGYATGGFGKWGLGDRGSTGVPEEHGFDVFFGYYHQVHAHTYYPKYLLRNSELIELEGNTGDFHVGQTFSHDLIYQESIKFIRENRGRPFFAYLAWTPPHGLWGMPEDNPSWLKFRDCEWDAGQQKRPEDARMYAAMVHMADRQIGEVLALLQELGLEEKTLVMVCGDNGGSSMYFPNERHPHGFFAPNQEPRSGRLFRGGKGNFCEGGLRIPMIARWPGVIQPGTVSEHLWYFPDVMPTLAELTGAQLPEHRDGISIVPTLLGEYAAGRSQEKHKYLYWESHDRQQVAVRMAHWKTVKERSKDEFELYDLSRDIEEKHNIASEHPDIFALMKGFAEEAHMEQREGWYLDQSLSFSGKLGEPTVGYQW